MEIFFVFGGYTAVLFFVVLLMQGVFRPVPKRAMETLAKELKLEREGDTLRGAWNGVPVTITRKGRTAIVRAPAPPGLKVVHRQRSRGVKGERQFTGDASIDPQFYTYGDADRVAAAFDGSARVHLRELYSSGRSDTATVGDGAITRTLLGAELAPYFASLVLTTVTELSRALHAEPTAERLSGIARSDVYPGVRANTLAALARLHPGAPTERVARDLLADTDLDVRIAAARLAGIEGTAHLAAADPDDLDAAAEADPDGLPARLAALPEATLLGLLARANRTGRAAVGAALARSGSLAAVAPLLAVGFEGHARAIQARLGVTGDGGELSLADVTGGEVALAAEAGAVSLREGERG